MKDSRLTDSIAAYRAASLGSAPRPSTELLERLDARVLREVATSTQPVGGVVQWLGTAAPAASPSRLRAAFAWLAGLGLVTKIVIGMSVAAVATTGAGVAGVLPGEAQRVFDTVLPGLSPTHPPIIADHEDEQSDSPDDGEPTPSPTPEPATTLNPTNPGGGASDPDGMPGQSGENGQGDPNPAPGPGNNNGNGNPTPGEGNQGNGNGGGSGKPEDTPGGNSNK